MRKFQGVKGVTAVMFILVFLLGCETFKQDAMSSTPNGYTQLDQNNLKDKEFYLALKNSLKKVGSLITVYANTNELSLYREGKRPYPTNYRYTIKANTKASLEELKQANLSLN